MRTFTISVDGNIAAFGEGEAVGRLARGSKRFRSERELGALTKGWSLDQLVEVWNRLPGVPQVKRFRDRKTAVARIWEAVQKLKPSSAKQEGAGGRKHPGLDSQTSRSEPAGGDPKTTRTALVIRMLERPGGATLSAIREATGWQAHSVRGLISGHLRRKLGLQVQSFERNGERVYAIQNRNDPSIEAVKTTTKGKRKR